MIAEPVDVLVSRDPCLAHRAPDLDDPGVRTEHGEQPILGASNGLFRVVFEFVEHADRRIAGELGAFFALRFEDPQILGRHFVIGFGAKRTQQHATPGVEENTATNIAMRIDEFHTGAHLRLAGGEVARAELLALATPFFREIPIEIEACFRARDGKVETVVVFYAAFTHDTEIFATRFDGIAAHH